VNEKRPLSQIEILHQISKLTNHYTDSILPLDLLTDLLKKLYLLFLPADETRFITLQCFSPQGNGLLQRMRDIPSVLNGKVIPGDKVPLFLKEIILFLSATQLINKTSEEGVANIISLFGDKFIIETESIDGLASTEINVSYKPVFNTLSIQIPHLFKHETIPSFFSFVDEALKHIQISSLPDEAMLVEGKRLDALIGEIMTSPELKAFAGFVESFLARDDIRLMREKIAGSVTKIEGQLGVNFPMERIDLFCKTILLHSLFKPSRYSYQVVVTRKDALDAPYYYGTILFNSNQPFPLDRLNAFHIGVNMSLSAINNAARLKRKQISGTHQKTPVGPFHGMVGDSKEIHTVFEKIEKVSRFDTDVLILGESGTGKDMIAQAIHRLSPYKDGPFIAVSLSDRPDSLIDSELFGHERGAFTGAVSRKAGYFERAEGGTLFLDEISHIPANIQAKLLRVFQSRSYERVGGHTPLKANIRIICATSEDLRNKEIRESLEFLDPLYYRLEQFVITVPSLRKRKQDIPLLVSHYLEKMNGDNKVCISDDGMDFLLSLDWPGNIRQLIASLKRAYIESFDDGCIEPRHFELEFEKNNRGMGNRNLETTLHYLRRNNFIIDRTLHDINTNAFKVSRKTLIRYTRELCLYFLSVSDWNLSRAIKEMASKVELERGAAIRYRNYFIGDKRSVGILALLNDPFSERKKELQGMVHNEFREHLNLLKGKLKQFDISCDSWNNILTDYL